MLEHKMENLMQRRQKRILWINYNTVIHLKLDNILMVKIRFSTLNPGKETCTLLKFDMIYFKF